MCELGSVSEIVFVCSICQLILIINLSKTKVMTANFFDKI